MQIRYPIFGIRNILFKKTFIVSFVWIAGLILGMFYLNNIPNFSLMRSVHFARMSIVGLFAFLLFPFLCSFILLRTFSFFYILPLVFLKAFMFISSYSALVLAYGNAGWLISMLMMFSDCVNTFLLLMYWFDAALGVIRSSRFNVVVYFIFPVLFGCFDYYFLSPLVTSLLKY